MPMSNIPLKFWKSFPPFTVGLVLGMLLILSLRVLYYDMLNLQPNMHPGLAFLFSPIILMALLCIALPSELVFRLWYAPTSHFKAGVIGLSYPSLLTFWAFPLHWWICFGLNPLILRTILSLTFCSTGFGPKSGTHR